MKVHFPLLLALVLALATVAATNAATNAAATTSATTCHAVPAQCCMEDFLREESQDVSESVCKSKDIVFSRVSSFAARSQKQSFVDKPCNCDYAGEDADSCNDAEKFDQGYNGGGKYAQRQSGTKTQPIAQIKQLHSGYTTQFINKSADQSKYAPFQVISMRERPYSCIVNGVAAKKGSFTRMCAGSPKLNIDWVLEVEFSKTSEEAKYDLGVWINSAAGESAVIGKGCALYGLLVKDKEAEIAKNNLSEEVKAKEKLQAEFKKSLSKVEASIAKQQAEIAKISLSKEVKSLSKEEASIIKTQAAIAKNSLSEEVKAKKKLESEFEKSLLKVEASIAKQQAEIAKNSLSKEVKSLSKEEASIIKTQAAIAKNSLSEEVKAKKKLQAEFEKSLSKVEASIAKQQAEIAKNSLSKEEVPILKKEKQISDNDCDGDSCLDIITAAGEFNASLSHFSSSQYLQPLSCVDNDGDGSLDFSMGIAWKNDEDPRQCEAYLSNDSKSKELFLPMPGSAGQCSHARVNLPIYVPPTPGCMSSSETPKLECTSKNMTFDSITGFAVTNTSSYDIKTRSYSHSMFKGCNCDFEKGPICEDAEPLGTEGGGGLPSCDPLSGECTSKADAEPISCVVDGKRLPAGTIMNQCSAGNASVKGVHLRMKLHVAEGGDKFDLGVFVAQDGKSSAEYGSKCNLLPADSMQFLGSSRKSTSKEGGLFTCSSPKCISRSDPVVISKSVQPSSKETPLLPPQVCFKDARDSCPSVLSAGNQTISASNQNIEIELACVDTDGDGFLDFDVGMSWKSIHWCDDGCDYPGAGVNHLPFPQDGKHCSHSRVNLPIYVPTAPVATTSVKTPVATTSVKTPVATTSVKTPVATTSVKTPVTPTGDTLVAPIGKTPTLITVQRSLNIGVSLGYNICKLSKEDQDQLVAITLAQVKAMACANAAACAIKIVEMCESSPSNGRRLQVIVGHQMVFDVILNSICDSASLKCSSQAVVDLVMNNFQTELQTGAFESALLNNPTIQTLFGSNFISCLTAWGQISLADDISDDISDEIQDIANPGNDNLYYPDFNFHSLQCFNDGDQPAYMASNAFTWLFDTRKKCCEEFYFGWNFNKCMNPKGSGLWFVSYSDGKCVRDCITGPDRTCGGLANPISDDLFPDPKSCCAKKLSPLFGNFCEAQSLLNTCYTGSGKYYAGYYKGRDLCTRDCFPNSADPTCGGIIEESWVELYDMPETCCDFHFDYIKNDLCAGRSSMTPVEKYWPDKTRSKCFKDSDNPAKDLAVSIYDTVDECCSEAIAWLSKEDCVNASI